jgi:Domain of unknown function (DUF4259)
VQARDRGSRLPAPPASAAGIGHRRRTHRAADESALASGLFLPRFIVLVVGQWGVASFENDKASDWFFLVEEAVDPGGVIASALDSALSEADYLGLDASCQAIAAAELSASCAGHASEGLPDHVRQWVDAHPHQPHDSETEQAVQAVQRVRAESELRDFWDERVEGEDNGWLREVDDLIARLGRSGVGDPATLSP